MANRNTRSVEHKKPIRKLKLKKEVVKNLTAGDLKKVKGGKINFYQDTVKVCPRS